MDQLDNRQRSLSWIDLVGLVPAGAGIGVSFHAFLEVLEMALLGWDDDIEGAAEVAWVDGYIAGDNKTPAAASPGAIQLIMRVVGWPASSSSESLL